MAQDSRDRLKNFEPKEPKLSKGHETRFEDKLEKAFSEKPPKNSTFFWLKIAAGQNCAFSRLPKPTS